MIPLDTFDDGKGRILTHIHQNCNAHMCPIKYNPSGVEIPKQDHVGVSAKALC